MKLTQQDLLKEFHNTGKYSDISFEGLEDICHGPWRYLKKGIQNLDVWYLRLKYFGTFRIYAGRSKIMLEKIKVMCNDGYMKEEKYNFLRDKLERVVKSYENEHELKVLIKSGKYEEALELYKKLNSSVSNTVNYKNAERRLLSKIKNEKG